MSSQDRVEETASANGWSVCERPLARVYKKGARRIWVGFSRLGSVTGYVVTTPNGTRRGHRLNKALRVIEILSK